MFLEIKGTYVCPDCKREYPIEEVFEGDKSAWDSEHEIVCECGLVFTINLDFND